MLFPKLNANKYGIGLSNELIFITIDQGAAKLEVKKIFDLGPIQTPFYKVNEQVQGNFLEPPTLTGHSFAAS